MHQEAKSDPDPEPGLEPGPDDDPDPKSQLLCGLCTGVVETLFVMSIENFPPFVLLMLAFATVVLEEFELMVSCKRSNRYPSKSELPGSRQATRRPQGFQVQFPGRRMSQAPGLDRLTRSEPGDGTNGVTIDAIATGDPERSCIVIDQPLRSLLDCSFSDPNDDSQLLGVLCSVIDVLETKFRSLLEFLKPNLQVKTACFTLP